MNKHEDAGYQIARAELVKAFAEAILNGVDYKETQTNAFHDEVEAAAQEMINAELVQLDEMRQMERDSQ